MAPRVSVQPSLETVQQVLSSSKGSPKAPNLVPLCASIPADLLTPSLAYLKVSAQSKSKQSFLFESAATTETIGRYSFVGADPRKVLKTGPGHGPECDPLPLLEEELSQFRVATIPDLILPPLTGGAIGYVGYDCVRYFEPKTARPMKDVLHLPEALFMLFNTIIAFDHFYQVIKVVTYLSVPPSSTPNPSTLSSAYNAASATLSATIATLLSPDIPLPPQPPITPNQEYTSNIGQSGYENHVKTLKRHITRGNIIQAVPSQRFSRPTSLHPFNIYRHLRTVNPSPYLFYIDCGGAFQLVGASPELLVKGEKGRIVTHPIAGTVKRGTSPEADEALANELRNSLKDRAEHVMLVDLARNDVNRVCDPLSTRVDRLMVVEKFSHVQHLVSQVSGVLRKGKNRFDAFRSIFPAGTVSGAPKVRAMELIAELEGEKRGVYAGAVGYFGYGGVRFDGSNKAGSDGLGVDAEMVEAEGAMDTCIALRTMLVKDGVAYLQAGGGVVFDSDPYEEWVETMNKLGANMQCIASAEERYASVDDGGGEADGGAWEIGGRG
ncbi:MAG: anthranilate synthase component i [Lasallia pustulata]|uniref:Anthranilate synthase component i n=1 Tax=Lasallia pustulata TaxID=136370 RepID=A0A5M8Q2G4_9LECA|nr:MAG: anthranilate synthase component i [Lasallia pustulata]